MHIYLYYIGTLDGDAFYKYVSDSVLWPFLSYPILVDSLNIPMSLYALEGLLFVTLQR